MNNMIVRFLFLLLMSPVFASATIADDQVSTGKNIRQYYLYISSQDSLELYTRDVWSKEYLGHGTFVFDGKEYLDVLFRFRGHCYGRGGCNGTKPNKSFKIKFSKKNKLDGVTKNLDINVIWKYSKSQGGVYRSKLPMDVFALAGYPAPKTRWCEFYLNNTYMGLFMEQEELDSGPFLEERFGDESGNMYKFDKVSVDSAGHTRFWREINVEENVDWSDFEELLLLYEEKNKNIFWQEIEKIINVDKFLEHAALNMLCCVSDLYNYGRKKSWDSLRTHEIFENPTLYHEKTGDKFILIPWDTNSALYNSEMDLFPNPWTTSHALGYILENPVWRKTYILFLQNYLDSFFTVENMQTIIDSIYKDTQDAMVRHNERWVGDYEYYDLEAEREFMINFIEDRIVSISRQLKDEMNPPQELLPFNVSWQISPPLLNGTDFVATTNWGTGKGYYLDRSFVFLEKNPILSNGVMLKTFNNMKRDSLVSIENRDIWTCTVTADTPVVAYLLWDNRTFPFLPDWISPEKWAVTSAVQQTTDGSMGFFDILRGYFNTNEPIVLGHHQPSYLAEVFQAQSFWSLVLVPTVDSEFPAGNELFQNFPNPFNNSTTLRYSLLDAAFVELEVYNISGQKVRHLTKSVQPPGYYNIIWDGTDDNGKRLASGVYWCTLIVENKWEIDTIKLLLLR